MSVAWARRCVLETGVYRYYAMCIVINATGQAIMIISLVRNSMCVQKMILFALSAKSQFIIQSTRRYNVLIVFILHVWLLQSLIKQIIALYAVETFIVRIILNICFTNCKRRI